MRKKEFKIGTIIFGITIAMVVVCSQIFYFQAEFSSIAKHKQKQEQSSSSEKESASYVVLLPSSTLPSSVSIELNHEFSFILDLLFEDNEQEEENDLITLTADKLFVTLFRVIISPNAP